MKPATRDDLELVGATFGDGISPLGHCALRNIQGFSKRDSAPEVLNCGGFSHYSTGYSILNTDVKDAAQPSELSCLHVMSTMGQRIRQLRDAAGFTQQQLAGMLSVSKGAVSQWEGDTVENIKLKTVLALCELLHTDLPYLVYGPGRRPTNVTSFPTSDTGKFRLARGGRPR